MSGFPVTRSSILSLATLVMTCVLALALWRGLHSAREATPIAAVPHESQDEPVVVAVHELAPPAPDAPLASEDGDEGGGDRVEAPDPLEAAVSYLGTANPRLYASLTLVEARQLTEIDLGAANVSDADVAELRKLPALQSISVSGAKMESLGKLLTLRSKLVEIRNQGTEVLVYLSR